MVNKMELIRAGEQLMDRSAAGVRQKWRVLCLEN